MPNHEQSPPDDAYCNRLLAIAHCLDELAAYIVYRKTLVKSLEADFTKSMSLRKQQADLIKKLLESGNVRYDSPPLENHEDSLFASIDEASQSLADMDTAAMGLIKTHNELVREL